MSSSKVVTVPALLRGLAKELGDRGWDDLVEQLPTARSEEPVRIAFVGPYNSGKSSLIAALTGDPSIPRSGKPESHTPRRYAWKSGVELVDLPGWFSGVADHDERANQDLRQNADLVAFVLTVELGNETLVEAIGHVFGSLGFAERAVVVVNKALSEDSDPEVITEEVKRRLGRYSSVPMYRTDAQSLLDTISGEFDLDDESIQILTESSGITELAKALEWMVEQHGATARMEAQVLQGARVAAEALGRLAPDDLEVAARRRLDELEAAISNARDRLNRLESAHLSRMESGIIAIADHVLAEPSLTEKQFSDMFEAACQPAQDLANDADGVLMEVSETLGGIVAAFAPDIADVPTVSFIKRETQPEPGRQTLGRRVVEAMEIDVAWVVKQVGEAGTKVARDGSGRGSIAYDLARKLQPKKVFKPYGRLKDAGKITKGAKWLGKAGLVIPAIEEGWKWLTEVRDLREAERTERRIRQHYTDVAQQEVVRVRSQFESWRGSALAPYELRLRAGWQPLEELSGRREEARKTIGALRVQLLDGLAPSATVEADVSD